eukprot:CAMPEP_0194136304 /NCGR_PEP_ID=MMETSP0152-20130528/6330_1 /TAXON_ID=1049557 /ORGANISM="Thalassiothrix antarctica, Strain L6-D1" /LENGTH=171 /DNA_ID=CAMNT_0038832903 /DNA_START=26 /DNA_END=541 /DNA_ORIENTATION=-
MTSLLSPLSPPFHPTKSIESSMICNNGIPTLTPVGTDFIRGISDAAIDECFPPTAQDVAEMEAVEYFVATLARLDLLEEREERIRSDISILPKRWAVRRELRGKPRPARSEVSSKSHSLNSEEIQLVAYDKKQRSYEKNDHTHNANLSKCIRRANKKVNSRPIKPIKQPRK